MVQHRFAVVVATKNSRGMLPPLIESIESQIIPHFVEIQIYAIDGGSTDGLEEYCSRHQIEIIRNHAGDPVSAKLLALESIKADYIMFLDHDERLLRSNTVNQAIAAFEKHRDAVVVLMSGYDSGSIGCSANYFASEYGDFFSWFVYRTSAMSGERYRTMKRRLHEVSANGAYSLFRKHEEKTGLILEAAALGAVVRTSSFEELVMRHRAKAIVFPLDYLEPHNSLVLLHDYPIAHQSVSTWRQIRTKTRWRVANAVNQEASLNSTSGVHGHNISRSVFLLRSLLFCFYTASLVLPLVDVALLAIKRRKPGLVVAAHLSYFTLFEILRQQLLYVIFGRAYKRDYSGGVL